MHIPIHQHQPLRVWETGDELSTYKPPWEVKDASSSFNNNGLHEAAASILWCNRFPPSAGAQAVIAGGAVNWAEVSPSAPRRKTTRIMCPTMLVAVVNCATAAERDAFAWELTLLSGHSYVAS